MTLPVKGQEFTFVAKLDSVVDPGFQVNPTLASGDFKASTDSGAFVNLPTPVVTPTGSSSVLVTVPAAQAQGDIVEVMAKDQSDPPEWIEVSYIFELFDGSLEVISDILQGDITESNVNVTIKKKGTSTVVLEKDISGSLLESTITVRTTEPV